MCNVKMTVGSAQNTVLGCPLRAVAVCVWDLLSSFKLRQVVLVCCCSVFVFVLVLLLLLNKSFHISLEP